MYTLTGFDLTTHNSADGDDSARPRSNPGFVCEANAMAMCIHILSLPTSFEIKFALWQTKILNSLDRKKYVLVCTFVDFKNS
jgi:hypothetical protein